MFIGDRGWNFEATFAAGRVQDSNRGLPGKHHLDHLKLVPEQESLSSCGGFRAISSRTEKAASAQQPANHQ